MRFSLILATVGRTRELETFLRSLEVQAHQDFELIVVDQNPDDRLCSILEPYEARCQIRHVRTRTRGLSRARNLGLEHVCGDVVGFPDDDCAYPPDLLGRVAEIFDRNLELDCLTGRSVDGNGETSSGRFAGRSGLVDRFNVWSRGISFTIFVRAEKARALRFDERLGAGAGTPWGSGEETEYLLRLLDQNGRLHYDPGLVVVHPATIPPYDAEARRKAYAYGCGMGHVMKRRRYPAGFRAMRLARPLGGAALSAASFRGAKAMYHWSIFRGRLKGLAS